jgi:hypothetical protein
MPEAAPVIITARPPSGLTAFAPSGLTAFAPSGLTARLPIAPRFVAIGPPLPVLVGPVLVDLMLIDLAPVDPVCSSICGTRAYQIDGTREYHRRQEEGAA